MIVWVTAVKPLGDYRLWVEFNDGTRGEVDLEGRLYGEVFAPLKDPKLFAQARLDPEVDTVVWPNGADFAPEFLYEAVKRGASEVAEP